MMRVLINGLVLALYAAIGGYFIREAIIDFIDGRYFGFGMQIMIAVMEAAYIFKVVLEW